MDKFGLWHRIFSGFILGTAMIIPGISGGVLAVIFGVYQPIVDAVAHPLTKGRSSMGFLWPLGLGAVISVLTLSNLLSFLFTNYPVPLLYLFSGLVLGSIPAMVRTASMKGFRLSYLTGTALAFITILGLSNLQAVPQVQIELSLGACIIAGAFLALGTVIPGLSSSFLLIAIGAYQPLLQAVARLDFTVLIPIGIGLVPSAWLASRLISLLFARYYGATNYTIFGILLATLFVVFPGLPQGTLELVVSGSLLGLGVWSVIKMMNISR